MSRMPSLPSLPKFKQVNRCECGCPGLTGNRFVPGHDAKLLGAVKRVKAGVWDKERPTDVLAQIDAYYGWADENLPGDPARYAEAVAKDMRVEWTRPEDREEAATA